MGTGTIFEEGAWARKSSAWQRGFFFNLPSLLSNFPTLDVLFWVGKSAPLPTQITKRKTRIVYLS